MQVKNEEKFDQRLRLAIERSGKDQKEIGNLAEISENSMTHYVKGRRIPKIAAIIKIAQMCDVDPNWLLTGQGDAALKQKDPGSHEQAKRDSAENWMALQVQSAYINLKITSLEWGIKLNDMQIGFFTGRIAFHRIAGRDAEGDSLMLRLLNEAADRKNKET